MATTTKTNERKKPVFLGTIILVVLIVTGGIIGYFWLIDTIHFVSTDDAAIDGDHVTISAKMLGRVKTLLVAERDDVTVGQLLVQLDDNDLKAQEKQAQASIKYARDNLVLSKVNLDRAQDDYQRTKTLYDKKVSTKEQYNHAQKAQETAAVQYTLAQAQVDTSQAQLGIIEAQLLNSRITAPIDGSVAKQSVQPGDVVQPGQAIFSINNLNHLWVTANFEETKVHAIRQDQPVEINIDAYSGKAFKGHVSKIAAGIVAPPFSIGDFTKTTQRVPIRIEFDSIPSGLVILPGMSVEVKIKVR